MQSTHLHRLLLSATLLFCACGGSTPTGSDNSGNNGNNGNSSCTSKYSGTVNGSAWCAVSAVADWYAGQNQVVISGVGATGTVYWSLTLSASSVTGPGTYALNTTTPLRFAVAGSSTGVGYVTNVPGGTGTITFTTLTSTHATGTYSYTAVANSGGTGTVTVTNGSFDVTLTPRS
jgi:hypothetical protein